MDDSVQILKEVSKLKKELLESLFQLVAFVILFIVGALLLIP